MGGKHHQVTGAVRGEKPSEGEKSNNIDWSSGRAQNNHQQLSEVKWYAPLSCNLKFHFHDTSAVKNLISFLRVLLLALATPVSISMQPQVRRKLQKIDELPFVMRVQSAVRATQLPA
jgi:hypothetical protein